MDFEAHYKAIEDERRKKGEEECLKAYNQTADIVRTVCENLLAQAHLNPPEFYRRVYFDGEWRVAWTLWYSRLDHEDRYFLLLTDGTLVYKEDGNICPVDLSHVAQVDVLRYKRHKSLGNILDWMREHSEKYYGISLNDLAIKP